MTSTPTETTTRSSLFLLTQITPAAWQVVTAFGIGDDRAGLNPQPLPPIESLAALNPQPLPPLETFQLAAATMAQEFARLAISANIQGRSGAAIISDMVDDWCLTGWPGAWPLPIHPEPGPHADGVALPPSLARSAQLVGALVLANIGSRLTGTELSATMLRSSRRLELAATA